MESGQNQEEFNIDKIKFRPLTKGLGFHHQKKEKVRSSSQRQYKVRTQPKKTKSSASEAVTHRGLEAIYGRPAETSLPRNPSPPKNTAPKIEKTATRKIEIKSTVEAPLSHRLGAYAIDVAAVLAVEAVLFALFVYTGRISVNMLESFLYQIEFRVFLGIVFIGLYLFYFTLFDLHQTLGKMLFSLRLVSSRPSRTISLEDTLKRASVSLIGLPVLGLIFFLPQVKNFLEQKIIFEEE